MNLQTKLEKLEARAHSQSEKTRPPGGFVFVPAPLRLEGESLADYLERAPQVKYYEPENQD